MSKSKFVVQAVVATLLTAIVFQQNTIQHVDYSPSANKMELIALERQGTQQQRLEASGNSHLACE